MSVWRARPNGRLINTRCDERLFSVWLRHSATHSPKSAFSLSKKGAFLAPAAESRMFSARSGAQQCACRRTPVEWLNVHSNLTGTRRLLTGNSMSQTQFKKQIARRVSISRNYENWTKAITMSSTCHFSENKSLISRLRKKLDTNPESKRRLMMKIVFDSFEEGLERVEGAKICRACRELVEGKFFIHRLYNCPKAETKYTLERNPDFDSNQNTELILKQIEASSGWKLVKLFNNT